MTVSNLTVRHLKVFFRDRAAVFFSVLSPLILFLLYFFFLGDSTIANLEKMLPGVASAKIELFLNAWIYAGIVATTAITTGLAAVGVFVNDRESGRFEDVAVSPVSRWSVVASYLLATMVIALSITTIVYALSLLHLSILDSSLPTVGAVLSTVGWYVLVAFCFGALFSLIATFIKSSNAFTAVSVVVGTGVGFLAGIYVPLGVLSESVSNILYALPFAQSAVLLRQAMGSEYLADLGGSELTSQMSEIYGFEVSVGGNVISVAWLGLILAVIGLLAMSAAVYRISKRVG